MSTVWLSSRMALTRSSCGTISLASSRVQASVLLGLAGPHAESTGVTVHPTRAILDRTGVGLYLTNPSRQATRGLHRNRGKLHYTTGSKAFISQKQSDNTLASRDWS